MAVAIPNPVSSDSEKVVSSLENAALFGRIGDHEEALRWVQRAAELAGDSGDDERTLVLARTAAELREAVSGGTEPVPVSTEVGVFREKRLPKPPGRSRPPAAETVLRDEEVKGEAADEDQTIKLVRPLVPKGAKRPPPPSSRPLTSRPPAPNGHHLPAPASQAPPASSVAPKATSVTPHPSKSEAPKAAVSVMPKPPAREAPKAAALPSHGPKAETNGSHSKPPGTVNRLLEALTKSEEPQSSRLRPPPKPSARPNAPAASPVAPAPHALSTSEAAYSDSATPASPTPVPGVARARSTGPATTAAHAAAPVLRQAARVSVEKSATEPGLFLVRVLDDGSAPPSGRVEALLVAVDPSSGLF